MAPKKTPKPSDWSHRTAPLTPPPLPTPFYIRAYEALRSIKRNIKLKHFVIMGGVVVAAVCCMAFNVGWEAARIGRERAEAERRRMQTVCANLCYSHGAEMYSVDLIRFSSNEILCSCAGLEDRTLTRFACHKRTEVCVMAGPSVEKVEWQ